MLKQSLSVFSILLVSFGNLQAQSNADEFRPKQLGLTISTLSGIGFFYLTDLTYEDNLKISALLWGFNKEDDLRIFDDGSDDDIYSFGLEYQRDLLESKRLRFHALTGISIDNTLLRVNGCSEDCYFTNAGVGLGLDIEISKGIYLNFHSTYQISRSYGSYEGIEYGFGGGIGFSLRAKTAD